jgi:hypothetical protein
MGIVFMLIGSWKSSGIKLLFTKTPLTSGKILELVAIVSRLTPVPFSDSED